MALGQIDLYNGALLLLKEESLVNLSEAREPRYKLDQIWNEGEGAGAAVINGCLAKGLWGFAKRTVQVNYDPSQSPAFGYPYVAQAPSDYIRMIGISADEQFMQPLNQFNEENGNFFTPFTQFYLRYVSNDPSYGGNMSKWPQAFTEMVKAYMAEKIVGRLTGSKADPDEVRKEFNRCLAAAQGQDALERPAQFPFIGSFAMARAGRRGMSGFFRGS